MILPGGRKCGGKTRVIRTRAEEDRIIRERACRECGNRFNTDEGRSRLARVRI